MVKLTERFRTYGVRGGGGTRYSCKLCSEAGEPNVSEGRSEAERHLREVHGETVDRSTRRSGSLPKTYPPMGNAAPQRSRRSAVPASSGELQSLVHDLKEEAAALTTELDELERGITALLALERAGARIFELRDKYELTKVQADRALSLAAQRAMVVHSDPRD